METKPGRKQLSHDRIVETAARAIRRAGYSGVGVADIMKEAGLTHGGFYAHFPSRDALLVEALERAGRDSASNIVRSTEKRKAKGGSDFRAFVESYLCDAHLAAHEAGCPVAALASEMPRQAPEVVKASVKRVQALVKKVLENMGPRASDKNAMAVASTLVGALQLGRALGSNAQGKALLAATRQALLAQYDTPAAA